MKKIWWDDYGDKEREEVKSTSEVKMFGIVQKEETHSIKISVGDKFWTVDLLENTGCRLILTGHLHIQDIAYHNNIYEITTGSLVSYPHPYRIIEVERTDQKKY